MASHPIGRSENDGRLDGGRDRGARLVGGTVRRPVRPWTPAVHALLEHLHDAGFEGAPRPLGLVDGEEALTYLPGRTVGSARPWPAWTHDDATLDEVGDWLRRYHVAVADHVPATGARWRAGGTWRPGQIVAHQDAAPYNAVWDGRLIGFVDWDMAGPADPLDDLAWVAFSWTPLHARAVVEAEGFADLAARRSRLERLARAYGWDGSGADLLDRVAGRLESELATMRRLAASGDPAYLRMLERGQDRDLEAARSGLDDV